MRQFIIAALAAILAACGQQKGFAEESQPERVAVVDSGTLGANAAVYAVRDEKRGVTCYVMLAVNRRGGLDCIPDSQLQQVAP